MNLSRTGEILQQKGVGSVENKASEVASRTGGAGLTPFPAHRNPAYNRPPVRDASGPAIAALIFGLCGMSLFGIGCGVRALDRVRNGGSNSRVRDRAFALIGIMFGVMWLVVSIAYFVHRLK